MPRHETINYVEFPSRDLEGTKRFFSHAFGWAFEDYGPDYVAFSNQGLDGGFFKSDLAARTEAGSALIVLYSDGLEGTLGKVAAIGPGGQLILQTAHGLRNMTAGTVERARDVSG